MIFKNYKKMYNATKEIADIRQQRIDEKNDKIALLTVENKELKEKVAKLTIDLEDTKGFLKQEQECCKALRNERAELREELEKYKPYFQEIEIVGEIDDVKGEVHIDNKPINSKKTAKRLESNLKDKTSKLKETPKKRGRKPKNAK